MRAQDLGAPRHVEGQHSTPNNRDSRSEFPEAPVDLDASNREFPSYLDSENSRGLWSNMSEAAKDVASQAYESLYKIPGVNRIVGKLEIAYNRFWADRHEEKAVALKGEVDKLNLRAEGFAQTKAEIESVIKDLREQDIPGVNIESLQLKLRDIDQQKIDLLNKKDSVQSQFEARENKVKLYTNERDRVADKLIGRYNEKLGPMEKELETLQSSRDQVDLLAAALEAKQKDQAERLGGLEQKKKKIEETLRKAGMSEKQIKKEATGELDDVIAKSRENMREEKEEMAARMTAITKRIAKVDERANPYRDKREEFNRLKEKRPLDIRMQTRVRGEEFRTANEETVEHTRGEAREVDRDTIEENTSEGVVETTKEHKERATAQDYIADWNKYIKENHPEDRSKETVDPKDFLRATTLSKRLKLEPVDFIKILDRYYKLKKVPVNELKVKVTKFLTERIEANKQTV